METNRAFDKTQIFAILTLVATIATAVSGVLGVVSPELSTILGGIGAAILAFLGRVQGTPVNPSGVVKNSTIKG